MKSKNKKRPLIVCVSGILSFPTSSFFLLAEEHKSQKNAPGDRWNAREYIQVVAGLEIDETETRIKSKPLETASHKPEKKDNISCKQEIRHMES